MIPKPLKNLLRKKRTTSPAKPAAGPVNIANCSRELMESFIHASQEVQFAFSRFISKQGPATTHISLGENCSSAWYLKQVGLKKASYPFDWVFSSPDIVRDCIEDRFATYMDKTQMRPRTHGKSAGHDHYHADFFNHRNPLASEQDYAYYQRCCDRFLSALQSKEPADYLITLINEPEKRPGWANGFSNNFSMPTQHDYSSLVPLFNTLKHWNNRSRLIVIEQYTESERGAQITQIDGDLISIKFHAAGTSTGVYYPDKLDDFCFKLIMTGLYGAPAS